MPQPQSDRALLAAAAQGDTDAFTPLISRHHAIVHRFVARRLGADDVEDIVSETFELALRQARRYRAETDTARPWLLGIAANLIRNRARREAAMYRAYARTGVDPAQPDVDAPLVDDHAQRALAGALAELRTEHREALLLHVLGELSYDEVAVAMAVPAGTVKAWIHRARAAASSHLIAAGVNPTEVCS